MTNRTVVPARMTAPRSPAAQLAAASKIVVTIEAPISVEAAWAVIFGLASDEGGVYEESASLADFRAADDFEEQVEALLARVLGVSEDALTVNYEPQTAWKTYATANVAGVTIDGADTDGDVDAYVLREASELASDYFETLFVALD